MERRVGEKKPGLNNPLAQIFLDEIDSLNREHGLIGSLGLNTMADWRTFRLQFAMRDVMDSKYWAQRDRPMHVRGVKKALVYYAQKFANPGSDPYEGALEDLKGEYDRHVQSSYSIGDQRPFQIRNAVNDLVNRCSPPVFEEIRVRESYARAIMMWRLSPQIVREWGDGWRGRLISRTEPGQ